MDAERDPAEAPDLSSLAREVAPPPDLEERTVATLRGDGLIAPRGNRRLALLRLAAAIVLFAGGVAFGRASARVERPDQADRNPRYILLLHGGPTGLTADQEAAVVREYGEWAVQLRAEGRFVTGERLGDASESVPPLDLPDVASLRGYFLISAAGFDDAVAVAERCPHARRGGHVIVRPLDPA